MSVRLVSVGDVAELTALIAQNLDFLAPWDPLRDADFATEAVQRRLITESLDRHAAGLALPLVITDHDRLVGRINVSDIVRGAFRSAHLGYWVSQDDTGRGVATAAVAATATLAFGTYGLHRLQAATLVHNLGSQRVLQRNGFTLIGLAPRYLEIAGRWQDHVLFQRVAPS
ncbi:MAG TPA: GNAT family N-acetyltransferase [Microlunatus sp.]